MMLCKIYGMAADTDRAWSASRRVEVLTILRSADAALTINEIADRLQVHPNTVRFHLEKLVEAGRVEQVPNDRRRPGRPPRQFRVVSGMDPAGPRHYRLLAEVLLREVAGGPDPESRAEAAGRSWGAGLLEAAGDDVAYDDPVGLLVSLLTQLGFAPEPASPTEPSTIALTHCPFLELVPIGPQLACQIHLGLMRGVLDATSTSTRVERLRPFVQPDRCVALLAAV